MKDSGKTKKENSECGDSTSKLKMDLFRDWSKIFQVRDIFFILYYIIYCQYDYYRLRKKLMGVINPEFSLLEFSSADFDEKVQMRCCLYMIVQCTNIIYTVIRDPKKTFQVTRKSVVISDVVIIKFVFKIEILTRKTCYGSGKKPKIQFLPQKSVS